MQRRRGIFGNFFVALAVVTGLVLAAVPGADAERYRNQSGLSAGRFVWNPTLAPQGPVTIVVSPTEGSAHVYRNGLEIGITTIETRGSARAAGVFLVWEIDGRIQDGGSDKPLVWRGMELFTGGAAGGGESDFQATLPQDLAELLTAATHRGAAVIVARERSVPQLFSAPGPFINPLETGSLNRVARFARPELRAQFDTFNKEPEPAGPGAKSVSEEAPAGSIMPPLPSTARSGASVPAARAGGLLANDLVDGKTASSADVGSETLTGVRGEITSIILSRADLSAYVMKEGRLADRLPIAVDQPTQPFGLHAAVLVTPGTAAREARWLAFGLDDDGDAAHVAKSHAERALRRVRFMDRRRSAALARSLRPGMVMVLMDGHGPSATEAPRFDVAVLTSEAEAPSLKGPKSSSSSAGPAPAAEQSSAEGQRPSSTYSKSPRKQSHSVAKQQEARPRRLRKRGPLYQREAWPNSMYWPY